VLTIVSALSTRFGTGRHIEALSLSQAEPGLKLLYASRLLYLLVITACKYAFCASYLRIFRERTSRIAILCLTGFITLYTIPIFFATAFPCLPPSNVWHIATTKSCYDGPKADALTYATGLFNVLGDILLLGFVIPQICRAYFIIY
jgi:cation transport ATPase